MDTPSACRRMAVFAAELKERVEVPVDEWINLTVGAKKRFKGFDPEAVKSLSSSLRSTAEDAVPKPQRKFSAPDERVRKRADRSFSYCYNGQAVVAEHLQVIGAAEMNQAANDHGN